MIYRFSFGGVAHEIDLTFVLDPLQGVTARLDSATSMLAQVSIWRGEAHAAYAALKAESYGTGEESHAKKDDRFRASPGYALAVRDKEVLDGLFTTLSVAVCPRLRRLEENESTQNRNMSGYHTPH